jgi:pimeloyl-ACP methyl ester carboxylesterase/DNA-binding CsgD family transcriptional regulator
MKQHIRYCHSTDGVRIAYATSGIGPPLVWAANWLTHLELDLQSPIYAHWFKALSRRHTLVRFDARGNGLSDRLVDTFSVEAWAKDLQAVVDDLGLEQFTLFGFCQGGATAMTYAASHPRRVRRLILYDAYVQGAFAGSASLDEQREAEALAELIAVGWGQETSAFRELFANLLIPQASPAQQRWLCELERRTVSPETAERLWRAFHHIDVRETARRVQVPTLIFHVQGDRMVPFAQGKELAALIPDSRFVPLEGKNHVLMAEDPAWPTFLGSVRDFLDDPLPQQDPAHVQEVVATLTPREREVLHHVALGLSNPQIAERLVIAPKTVRNHVSRIYHKLGVERRAQAILLAQQAGIDRFVA